LKMKPKSTGPDGEYFMDIYPPRVREFRAGPDVSVCWIRKYAILRFFLCEILAQQNDRNYYNELSEKYQAA